LKGIYVGLREERSRVRWRVGHPLEVTGLRGATILQCGRGEDEKLRVALEGAQKFRA